MRERPVCFILIGFILAVFLTACGDGGGGSSSVTTMATEGGGGGSVTLTVTKTGPGRVTSLPAGIDCGATCSATFAMNTVVTLTASPDSGATFSGWDEACSGVTACSVTLAAAQSVSATFSSSGSAVTTGATETVTAVADGDTITLSSGPKVRLLGIDAPESFQFYSQDSTGALTSLVLNKAVRLEADQEDVDSFNRLLRYVWVGEVMVNEEMVRQGMAHVRIVKPNVKYASRLRAAQTVAKQAQVGLWRPSTITCVAVVSFDYAIADERFALKNNCSTTVEIGGWVFYDEGNEQRSFPTFSFLSGSTVTVHTRLSSTSTQTDLFVPTGKYIWNNDYDTLFVRDGQGLVLSYSYGQ